MRTGRFDFSGGAVLKRPSGDLESSVKKRFE